MGVSTNKGGIMSDQLTYDDLYRIRLELLAEIDRLKGELKEGEDCAPKIVEG